MKKSQVLLWVGIVLIVLAFCNASSIPISANEDLVRMYSTSRLSWSSQEGEYLYVQASILRRILQNFYVGASGLICLSAGLLSNSSTKQKISQ